MLPRAASTGSPAPIAAAIGSSISTTSRAPACITASSTARRSTSVIPDGIHTITRGFIMLERASFIKLLIIAWVMSKSAMTPSFMGRTAMMFSGVRPIMSFASLPTASTLPVYLSIATTDGSLTVIPRPLTYTRVFAVPKSIPISFANIPIYITIPFITQHLKVCLFQNHFSVYRKVPRREARPRWHSRPQCL